MTESHALDPAHIRVSRRVTSSGQLLVHITLDLDEATLGQAAAALTGAAMALDADRIDPTTPRLDFYGMDTRGQCEITGGRLATDDELEEYENERIREKAKRDAERITTLRAELARLEAAQAPIPPRLQFPPGVRGGSES